MQNGGTADLLVAPMMKTVFLEFMPSISVSSWLSTRSAAPPASPALQHTQQHNDAVSRNSAVALPL